jgi:hypothetical protein
MATFFRYVRVWNQNKGRYVQVRVDLWIDIDKLAKRIGTNAYNNKSGKARFAAGAILAEAKLVDAL